MLAAVGPPFFVIRRISTRFFVSFSMTVLFMTPEVSLAAETLWRLGPLRITNALLASWLVTGFLVVFALWFRSRMRDVPGRVQALFESVVTWLVGLADAVTGSREKSERFFPLVASLFLFILALNWFGLLPGVGPLGVYQEHHGRVTLVPLLRGGNADLNSTLALALIAVVATHLAGFKQLGVRPHLGKFLNFTHPIGFFVGLLEAISELAKIVSFSFRLFGNIFAGEVLLLIVAALVPYLAPLPFFGLELFVGFVQALVFATLTLVFLQLATHHGETAGGGHS